MTRKGRPWVYPVAFLAMVGLVWLYADQRGLEGTHGEHERSTQRLNALRDEAARLDGERAALQQRVEYLKSDPVEKEDAIRQRKNLVRPGETDFRVELSDE